MDDIVKICKIHGELTEDNTYFNRLSTKGKKYLRCGICRNNQQKSRYHSNPAKYIAMASGYNKKHKNRIIQWNKDNPGKLHGYTILYRFKMTSAQYRHFNHLKRQNNVCAICKKPENQRKRNSNSPRMLAVDHCHATGRIRGLLCHQCNVARCVQRFGRKFIRRLLFVISRFIRSRFFFI